jgi:hypothetical protein
LEENPQEIYWPWLSLNPNAIHLLEKNPDKIIWGHLSGNPNAMHILEENKNRIFWSVLSTNSSIFNKKLNYEFLTERMNIIREELMMKCMHPRRLERWIEMGGDIDDF